MNQSGKGRLTWGGANQSVSMVIGCLPSHSGARGRSLAGPSAKQRLAEANQEKDVKKKEQSNGGEKVLNTPRVSRRTLRPACELSTAGSVTIAPFNSC